MTNLDPVQQQLPLIEHDHGGRLIRQRAKDGYINATAMCRAAGRRWSDYRSLLSTQPYLSALSSKTAIPVSELIQSFKGGDVRLQGTWVHPQVAIHLAQWLSPEFAVEVSHWVFEWLSGGPKVVERLPYHMRRYVANMTLVPKTHFSMLQELTYGLIAPMEAEGYTLPDHMVPDISEGRMFCAWLRKTKGVEPSSFPTYPHRYEDGRTVPARLYPNELLADFRHHFQNEWLPNRASQYFATRDPKALAYLPKLIGTSKPSKKSA